MAVIKDCSYILAHVPDFVRYGSKPIRDIANGDAGRELEERIYRRVRSYEDAVAYPPNQVFIGNLSPDQLREIPEPWYEHLVAEAAPQGPFGEIQGEEELYGWLKCADDFDLICFTPEFSSRLRDRMAADVRLGASSGQKIGDGARSEAIEKRIADDCALPLLFEGERIGLVRRDHEADDSLKAHVLLENLLAKASGALAMHHLFRRADILPADVDFILSCSEDAVGDRYNRGGGSLSKAIGEMCGCVNASGHDVKAFCASPIHALVEAASLVEAGVYQRVVVVGGGSLAKIGMKYSGHLRNEMPILEDVLGGIAFLVTADDGFNPIIRLDAVGKHPIGAASSQQAIMTSLISVPLEKAGLNMLDIDRYATEMHNPEVTLPAGSGNTPLTNYKIMAALAAIRGEIAQADMEAFVTQKGMPGFSPTQGHVPAAVPYLGHALEEMRAGRMRRAMFVAKGSLFLGRMSQLSDGLSFLLEANPGADA